jgi:hypothetical protein
MRRLLALFALAALLPCPAPTGAAAAEPEEELVFVKDTNRLVALIRYDYEIVGHLDETGFFTPDPKYRVVRGGRPGTSGQLDVLNGSPGTAYEYRSGRLILGEFDQDGNFVPDLGSKVIAFMDYKPGGNAPGIYNLPGRWVRKGEEEVARKAVEQYLEHQKRSDELRKVLEAKEAKRQKELDQQRREKELERQKEVERLKQEVERLKKELEGQKHKDKP